MQKSPISDNFFFRPNFLICCSSVKYTPSAHVHARTHAHTRDHKLTNMHNRVEQLKNFVACSALVEMKQEGSEFLIALKVHFISDREML